jgi:hypothetical protein
LNYTQALEVLEKAQAGEGDCGHVEEEQFYNAACKATQAVRDCLEMGLNGEGE